MADAITKDQLKAFVKYTKPTDEDDALFDLWVQLANDEVAAARGSVVEPWPAWCRTAALLIGKHLWRQTVGRQPSQQAGGPDPRKEADALIAAHAIPPVAFV